MTAALSEKELYETLMASETVNPFTVTDLFRLLESGCESQEDLQEMDRLCYSIVSNLCENKPLAAMQRNDTDLVWYDYLGLQIYLFLTGKGQYETDRAATAFVGGALVANIVDSVSARCQVESDLLPLVVSLLLCVAGKLAAGAWCQWFYSGKISRNRALQKALREESEKR